MVMARKLMILWVFLGLALPMITGPAAWGAQELTVSAAASLTNAFPEIGQRFEEQHPGIKVIFNLAASGSLLQQMAQGAPVDVFASADEKTMNQAQEKGLIVRASRKDFASNTLVLIVPQDSGLALTGPKDLLLPKVKRVAVGNPATVPVGRYTREALTRAGLWQPLQSKLIMGESVRQVLEYVRRGEVDAGFVYATDAAMFRGQVKTVAQIQGHQPIVYPMAVVAASGKQKLAELFLNYVLSPQGREILGKYGFGPP
jgi:molybdate transport system substrate-binding protein